MIEQHEAALVSLDRSHRRCGLRFTNSAALEMGLVENILTVLEKV